MITLVACSCSKPEIKKEEPVTTTLLGVDYNVLRKCEILKNSILKANRSITRLGCE